jgi:hypothetical protein
MRVLGTVVGYAFMFALAIVAPILIFFGDWWGGAFTALQAAALWYLLKD